MPKIFQAGERIRIGQFCGIDSQKTGTVITTLKARQLKADISRLTHSQRVVRLDDGIVCIADTVNLFHENPLAEAVMSQPHGFMTRVKRCKCPDGVRRSVSIISQPDTFFSIPAQVRAYGKTVTGYVTSCETDGKPDYEFRPYLYRKNHVVFTKREQAASEEEK